MGGGGGGVPIAPGCHRQAAPWLSAHQCTAPAAAARACSRPQSAAPAGGALTPQRHQRAALPSSQELARGAAGTGQAGASRGGSEHRRAHGYCRCFRACHCCWQLMWAGKDCCAGEAGSERVAEGGSLLICFGVCMELGASKLYISAVPNASALQHGAPKLCSKRRSLQQAPRLAKGPAPSKPPHGRCGS